MGAQPRVVGLEGVELVFEVIVRRMRCCQLRPQTRRQFETRVGMQPHDVRQRVNGGRHFLGSIAFVNRSERLQQRLFTREDGIRMGVRICRIVSTCQAKLCNQRSQRRAAIGCRGCDGQSQGLRRGAPSRCRHVRIGRLLLKVRPRKAPAAQCQPPSQRAKHPDQRGKAPDDVGKVGSGCRFRSRPSGFLHRRAGHIPFLYREGQRIDTRLHNATGTRHGGCGDREAVRARGLPQIKTRRLSRTQYPHP